MWNGVVGNTTTRRDNQMVQRANGREPHGGGSMMQPFHSDQRALVMGLRSAVLREFSSYVTEQETAHQKACDEDRRALEKREEKNLHHREYIAQLDARNEQEERRLRMEEERLRAEDAEREQRKEQNTRRQQAYRRAELWAADGEFFHLLALGDLLIAACTIAWRGGFSLNPASLLSGVWGLVVADCREEFSGSVARATADSTISTAISTYAAANAAISAAAASTAAAASGCSLPSGNEYDPMGNGGTTQGGLCATAGGEMSILPEDAGGSGTSPATAALWWAWSTVASYAGAAVHAGYSTSGWVLGQTLSLVSPDVKCEIKACLSTAAWLFSLWVALRLAGSLGADGRGPAAAVTRLIVLASWVWGKFHAQLIEATHEIFLPAVAAPLLVLAYAPFLRYVERHLKPAGVWWWRGWDVRPIVSRVGPTVVTAFVAVSLGLQAGCGAGSRSKEWWCVM
ncbi:unnamed protein product [Sphacelaria rigidula]